MFDSDRLPALSIIASPNHQTIPLFHPQMFSSFFLSLTCLLHTEKSRPWPIQATADPNRNSFWYEIQRMHSGFWFCYDDINIVLHTGFCVEGTPPPPGYLPFISPFLTCASCRVFHQTSHSASNVSPQPASLSFSQCPLFPLPPSPHGPLPMSPTDPITECFLTGR